MLLWSAMNITRFDPVHLNKLTVINLDATFNIINSFLLSSVSYCLVDKSQKCHVFITDHHWAIWATRVRIKQTKQIKTMKIFCFNLTLNKNSDFLQFCFIFLLFITFLKIIFWISEFNLELWLVLCRYLYNISWLFLLSGIFYIHGKYVISKFCVIKM